MTICLYPHLPYEQTFDACCLDTQLEVKILTGEWIHAVYRNDLDTLFVSAEAFAAIKGVSHDKKRFEKRIKQIMNGKL
jgi:hypothetical protein